MNLTEILPQLTAWFPAEDHKKRKLKGNGEWYFVEHTTIRDRLNEVCPGHWSDRYILSHMVGTCPIYLCELTICGITKTGIGDKSNESSPFGTEAQRAFRKAFTDAAEQFGIAAYLDEQTSDKTKRSFVKYMQSQGNGRVAQDYLDNQRIEKGEPPRQKPVDPPSRPFGQAAPRATPRRVEPTRSAGMAPQPELEPQERQLSEEEKKVVRSAIAGDFRRLRWTPEQGKACIQQRYQKNETAHLTDGELLHFSAYLSGLPESAEEAAEFDMALGNV